MNVKTMTGLLAVGAVAMIAATAQLSSSQAQQRPGGLTVNPNVVFKSCATGFRKTAGRSYTCVKIFRRLCKPGMVASRPYLRRVPGGRYMVSYRCMRAPH